MLEIVYRIYEVVSCNQGVVKEYEEKGEDLPSWYRTKDRHELSMDIMVVDSRDKFKEIIRLQKNLHYKQKLTLKTWLNFRTTQEEE